MDEVKILEALARDSERLKSLDTRMTNLEKLTESVNRRRRTASQKNRVSIRWRITMPGRRRKGLN